MPITIGVDMGGTKCLAVAIDERHRILARHQLPTPTGGADAVIDVLVAVVDACRREQPAAVGVGVGVPGLVTPDGVMRFAPHLPGVVDLRVAELVSARTGLAVCVGNDNTAAAIAEHRAGAGRGAPHLLSVGFGTGIGGAFLSDGRPVRGANGFAGELGHVVVDRGGTVCVCGRTGCWETVASGRALAERAGAAGLGSAESAVERALQGDAAAIGVVSAWSNWIGHGLADLVMILDPDRIVLAGGVVLHAAPIALPLITAALAASMGRAGPHRPRPEIVTAALGVVAAATGAAILAFDAR